MMLFGRGFIVTPKEAEHLGLGRLPELDSTSDLTATGGISRRGLAVSWSSICSPLNPIRVRKPSRRSISTCWKR